MKIKNNPKTHKHITRTIVFILAIIPLIYWRPFYEHFYTYLTGTVLNGIVKNQWHLVLFFIIIFAVFAIPLSYRKRAKWVDYSLITAFFVSLFIEMYGLPLTIMFASKYLFKPGTAFPDNVLEFNFLGVGLGMDHAMVYGAVLMILGMGLIIAGWYSLYKQSKRPGFARAGLYRISRHPQYVGFLLLVIGWFFGWPTILTVIFSPILVIKYLRAARHEEKDMRERFGSEYEEYMRETGFLI